MGQRSYAFDAELQLADGGAAMTASGVSQVGGADKVWDTGGNQGTVPVQRARIDAMLVIFVAALLVSNANNVYTLTVQGSNDPAFGEDNVQNLATMDFGNEAARLGGGGVLTTAAPLGTGLYPAGSMYELPFCTEQNDVQYQYVRLYVTVAGTNASFTFNAFAVDLSPT